MRLAAVVALALAGPAAAAQAPPDLDCAVTTLAAFAPGPDGTLAPAPPAEPIVLLRVRRGDLVVGTRERELVHDRLVLVLPDLDGGRYQAGAFTLVFTARHARLTAVQADGQGAMVIGASCGPP